MAGIGLPSGGGGRGNRRTGEASFDLNLAPFLDIIVSIIPMLLLSAVFIEIRMIETPIPQVVANAVENADQRAEKEVVITLHVSAKGGYNFEVNDKGKVKNLKIPLISGAFDYKELSKITQQLKDSYPQVFKLQLAPDKDVTFDHIVRTMDKVRQQEDTSRKIAFVDPKSGQKVETNLMFPNVTFSNVVGE